MLDKTNLNQRWEQICAGRMNCTRVTWLLKQRLGAPQGPINPYNKSVTVFIKERALGCCSSSLLVWRQAITASRENHPLVHKPCVSLPGARASTAKRAGACVRPKPGCVWLYHYQRPFLLFQPKYRWGNPENYLSSLSKSIFSGSKYQENSNKLILKKNYIASNKLKAMYRLGPQGSVLSF